MLLSALDGVGTLSGGMIQGNSSYGSGVGSLKKMLVISPEQLQRLRGEVNSAMKKELSSEMTKTLTTSTSVENNDVESMYRDWAKYRPLLDKFLQLKQSDRVTPIQIPIYGMNRKLDEGEGGGDSTKVGTAASSSSSSSNRASVGATDTARREGGALRGAPAPAPAPAWQPPHVPLVSPPSSRTVPQSSTKRKMDKITDNYLDWQRRMMTGVPALPPTLTPHYDYSRYAAQVIGSGGGVGNDDDDDVVGAGDGRFADASVGYYPQSFASRSRNYYASLGARPRGYSARFTQNHSYNNNNSTNTPHNHNVTVGAFNDTSYLDVPNIPQIEGHPAEHVEENMSLYRNMKNTPSPTKQPEHHDWFHFEPFERHHSTPNTSATDLRGVPVMHTSSIFEEGGEEGGNEEGPFGDGNLDDVFPPISNDTSLHTSPLVRRLRSGDIPWTEYQLLPRPRGGRLRSERGAPGGKSSK